MHDKQQFQNLLCRTVWCATMATAVLAIVLGLTVVALPTAQAQTFTILHNFTGGLDGASPNAGVTMDTVGNLYGTTSGGGTGYGTVYELRHKGSGWVFNPLHIFAGGSDGAQPGARVIFGPDGAIYGTTMGGGVTDSGTVFKLTIPPTVCKATLCPWTETVLHSFSRYVDGEVPGGDLLFDHDGNIYGTTVGGGGSYDRGVVYELAPSGTLSVLYAFKGSDGDPIDGEYPAAGVIFDSAGNLYGTTMGGGDGGGGTIFELSGGTETVLYNFGTGRYGFRPAAGLISDKAGNLYGATSAGVATVFELGMPEPLYSFTGGGSGWRGPCASLIMDVGSNLYGTTNSGGAYGYGSVFELTPASPTPGGTFPPGTWSYIPLHDFTGGSDGAYPYSNVIFDADGNLYGTASGGGTQGDGVVWKITR